MCRKIRIVSHLDFMASICWHRFAGNRAGEVPLPVANALLIKNMATSLCTESPFVYRSAIKSNHSITAGLQKWPHPQ
jgi:hypothetical protein